MSAAVAMLQIWDRNVGNYSGAYSSVKVEGHGRFMQRLKLQLRVRKALGAEERLDPRLWAGFGGSAKK